MQIGHLGRGSGAFPDTGGDDPALRGRAAQHLTDREARRATWEHEHSPWTQDAASRVMDALEAQLAGGDGSVPLTWYELAQVVLGIEGLPASGGWREVAGSVQLGDNSNNRLRKAVRAVRVCVCMDVCLCMSVRVGV